MNQPVVGFSSLMNFDKLIPIKLIRSEELFQNRKVHSERLLKY